MFDGNELNNSLGDLHLILFGACFKVSRQLGLDLLPEETIPWVAGERCVLATENVGLGRLRDRTIVVTELDWNGFVGKHCD